MEDGDRGAYIEQAGRQLFNRLIKTARSSFFTRRDECILDLKTLLDIVPAEAQYSGSTQDVRVDRIIGTENRAQDFSSCFYPRKEWMAERWTKVYKLLHFEGISEPLKLIEYGGYYFVRDGNHRVSVAIHSDIEFLTAEITHCRIPITLPDNLKRGNLDLLTEKYAFHRRTGIFNFVHDTLFQVACPGTWKKLETEIYKNSRSWFVRFHEREPVNDKEFIKLWVRFYKITVEHIHQRSLLLFFPGMRESDVFVELVEYWNSHQDPDSFWVGEIYDKFEHYLRKKRFFLWSRQFIYQSVHWLSAPVEEAKSFFLQTTRIYHFVPDFTPPVAGKAFYLLCYRQIFRINARLLMDKGHKQPTLGDINRLWFNSYYKPLQERYRQFLYPLTFERYYREFSRRYYKKIITGKISAQTALEEFEKAIL